MKYWYESCSYVEQHGKYCRFCVRKQRWNSLRRAQKKKRRISVKIYAAHFLFIVWSKNQNKPNEICVSLHFCVMCVSFWRYFFNGVFCFFSCVTWAKVQHSHLIGDSHKRIKSPYLDEYMVLGFDGIFKLSFFLLRLSSIRTCRI